MIKNRLMTENDINDYLVENNFEELKAMEKADIQELLQHLFGLVPKEILGFWEWNDMEEEKSERKYQFLLFILKNMNVLIQEPVDEEIAISMMFAARSLSYIAQKNNDMITLELAMRKWNEILESFSGKDTAAWEWELSKMHFALNNVHLFYINQMYKEAKSYTEQVTVSAQSVLQQLFAGPLASTEAADEYALHEGWNCILAYSTSYEYYVKMKEADQALFVMRTTFDYYRRLKPFLIKDAGHCEGAARYLWTLFATQNSYGDLTNARVALEESADLFQNLYLKYDKVYAQAMYLQAKVIGLFQMGQQGQLDMNQLEDLDKQRRLLMIHPDAFDFEKMIGEQLGVTMDLYRGIGMQVGEQYALAAQLFQKANQTAEECIGYFTKMEESKNPWISMVSGEMVTRLKGLLVSCMMQEAECSYFMNELGEAKALYEKMLKQMNLYQTSIPEIERMRALCRAYALLGDICSRMSDYEQGSFYFEEHIKITKAVVEQTGLLQDWVTHVYGCLFAIEFETNWKKIEKAKSYAHMGLEACAVIRNQDPANEALRLERQFEKTLKKKEKGGLFSKWF